MHAIDTRNAVTIPISSITASAAVNANPNLTNFRSDAPNITGIPRKKVNSAATVRETPSISPPSMVEPERDVPGSTAAAS